MLGIIPGIIGLITSPSANDKPIKSSKLQDYIAIAFWCLGVFYIGINLVYERGSWATISVAISIFSTANYFHKLSQGQVYNENPKFYFGSNQTIKQEVKHLSKIESLNNLKAKGILSEEEYMEKAKIVNQEIAEKKLKETEEYKRTK